MRHDLATPSVVGQILQLRKRAEPLVQRIRGDDVDAALLRRMRTIADRAASQVDDATPAVAVKLVADLHHWLAAGLELSPDPADLPRADTTYLEAAGWWDRAGEPGRAREDRIVPARNMLYRTGLIDGELNRLVREIDAAEPIRRANGLTELAELQLRAGDRTEGGRTLRLAEELLTATGPSPERRMLAYRVTRELADVTGDAALLTVARTQRGEAGPLGGLIDRYDDWRLDASRDSVWLAAGEKFYADLTTRDTHVTGTIAAAVARRLAERHLCDGDAARAEELLRDAIDRVPPGREHDQRPALLTLLARARADRDDWPEAERLALAAVRLIEPVRRAVNGTRFREGWTGDRISAYATAAEAAGRRGDAAGVLAVTELVKGRRLTRVRIGSADVLAEGIRSLRDARSDRGEAAEGEAGRWRRRLAGDAWEASGAYVDLPPLDLDQLQAALHTSEAVLSLFWLDAGRLAVATIRPGLVRHDVVLVDAAARDRLERGTAAVTSGLLGLAERPALRGFGPLGDLLLPRPELLEGVDRLYVSPHRLLHAVPFGLLETRGRALSDTMTVVLAPSLTSLQRPRQRPAGRRLLSVDVADFPHHPGVPNLPLVARAARAAAAGWQAAGMLSRALSDADATVAGLHTLNAGGELAEADVVQLVTHGRNPRPESAAEPLLLLYDGAIDDLDLAMWRLTAPLVLLIACHGGQRAVRAGSGAELLGDEANGLTAALFSAGAGAVLGALWTADEEFAAPLVERLHRRLRAGDPVDRALRIAVDELRVAHPLFDRHPHYWAPYQIITATLLPIGSTP